MRILIELYHAADVNFFKNAIPELKKKHGLYVVIRERGKLSKIFEKEIGLPYTIYGKHENELPLKILDFIKRTLFNFRFIRKRDIDLTLSFSGHGITLAAKLAGVPSINFYDDFEYKINFHLGRLFSTAYYIPSFIPFKGRNIHHFHGYKELAYLSPDRFKPSPKALKQYGIIPERYVFVRLISSTSLNYQTEVLFDWNALFSRIKGAGYLVVLSLEDKRKEHLFEKSCIVLNEPVDDIYSLMFHAKAIISSGDTMIREAALMGVPAVYLGGRDMLVNRELVRLGLIRIPKGDITKEILDIIHKDYKRKTRTTLSKRVGTSWVDTTDVILEAVRDIVKRRR
ncbi:DUF354 domain-containing protein [Candidatus Woesearchaeota archaeon]|nr:DUF354 domain-containing protein [Candidatus Woesearchaeota archaeon]